MTPDQMLQEEIIQLQKRDFGPDTQHLLEEAAQLLADGRDIEARALIEKAQALADGRVAIAVPGASKNNGVEQRERNPIAGIAERLVSRLADAFTESMQELQRDFSLQVSRMSVELEGRLMDRLAASVAVLEQADRMTSEELEALRLRGAAHDERLSSLESVVNGLASKVDSTIALLDAQTQVLRGMEQQQVHRVSVLNEVLDSIARLREPRPPNEPFGGPSVPEQQSPPPSIP